MAERHKRDHREEYHEKTWRWKDRWNNDADDRHHEHRREKWRLPIQDSIVVVT